MRTIATKQGRLELQKHYFDSLLNQGYTQEVYGDLNIFINTDLNYIVLKVYRGTATKEIIFKRYRTLESRAEAIVNVKASHDRSRAYKAELKANPTKSSSANCATAIREELKKEFPSFKFSVKSSNFAGGDSVSISWTEGPTTEQVEKFTRKYQYGRFDGMTDSYEYSNSIENLPQSKYVSTSREISEEVQKIVFESYKLISPEDRPEYELKQDCYRIISKTPFKTGAIVTGVTTTGQSGTLEDFYTLTFLLPETPEPKETTTFEAVEVPEGEIQIVDYSEKAIAVIGETKQIKDELKALGGKFNFRLSCGAGWIFPKTKLAEVQQLLSGGATTEEETEEEVKKIYDGKRDINGAFNIEGNLQCFDSSGTEILKNCKSEEPQEETTLKDEISETINFLAELDTKIYGEVTESVRECARVQEVEIRTAPEQIQLSLFI